MDAEPLPRKPMPARGEVVLKAVDVTRKFGGLVANNAMNLEIRAGEILALIGPNGAGKSRSEEHTSELQSLMRISYAVFCLTKKNTAHTQPTLNAYIEHAKTPVQE